MKYFYALVFVLLFITVAIPLLFIIAIGEEIYVLFGGKL